MDFARSRAVIPTKGIAKKLKVNDLAIPFAFPVMSRMAASMPPVSASSQSLSIRMETNCTPVSQIVARYPLVSSSIFL